jgi:uncharacterized membrane protein
MIFQALQIIIVVLFPFFCKWLLNSGKVPHWLSPAVLCYAVGILIGNIQPFPIDRPLARTLSEVGILFAIPLLLYSTNLVHWFRYAKTSLLGFFICAVSGFIGVSIAAYFFQNRISDIWKIAGMLYGVYTGGTANMQAVGIALQTPESKFVLLNASDVFTGGIYLLFLTSFAHSFFGLFLRKFEPKLEDTEDFFTPEKLPFRLIDSLKGILLTIGVVGVSVGSCWLIFGNMAQATFILLMLNTLSIGASFSPRIRGWRGTFVAFALTLTIFMNVLLSSLFNIDRDTMIITHTAGIYGPPFVGQVATAIGNRELIFSGMAMGLLGFALGNYCGIGLAYFLKWLL